MARQTLSALQRSAIRAIHDKPFVGWRGFRSPTIGSLENRGLITWNKMHDCYSLTTSGSRAYDAIMRTGDGPEDLKEMFKPIFKGVKA